jgi:hypothetical protein
LKLVNAFKIFGDFCIGEFAFNSLEISIPYPCFWTEPSKLGWIINIPIFVAAIPIPAAIQLRPTSFLHSWLRQVDLNA